MMKKKRVFLFMPYIPYPVDRGTYQRVYHLFVELARAFEVDLACLQDEEKRPMDAFVPLTNRCIAIPFDHPPWKKLFPDRLRDPLPTTVHHWQAEGVKEQLATFVEGETYDRVIFIDLVLWPYIRELFPNHPKKIMDRSRVDWLFQTEELKTLKVGLLNRFLRWENLRKIAKLERAVYRELAGMIVCGIDDRTFLEERLGDARKVFVLANGFNEDYFDLEKFPRAPQAEPRLLFCGALDYSPNVDAVDWFADEIWPRIHQAMPEAVWTIIGKSPDARAERWKTVPGVDFIGEVPDVRPFYQSSWLQVVPLRIGGGTRLKIVESLGMGCPVVSTTLGAQGLDLTDQVDLVLADDAASFAEKTVTLLQSEDSRRRLEEKGLATVRQAYRWEQLGQKLNQFIAEL